MAERDPSSFSAREAIFMIYALGWVLDQIGSILEHGELRTKPRICIA
jgi:hypothetical protein